MELFNNQKQNISDNVFKKNLNGISQICYRTKYCLLVEGHMMYSYQSFCCMNLLLVPCKLDIPEIHSVCKLFIF